MAPMGSLTARPRKTVDDLRALPDETRAELIGGEIYVTPAPFRDHQEVVENLHLLLATYVRARDLGRVHLPPMDVYLPSGDVVQPDLIYVSKARSAIRQDWIRGVPDLLVEVVSTSHPERDRIVKRALYAENGVPAYWILDPQERSVEVLRLEKETYAPAGFLAGTGTFFAPTFPDLEISLTEVFGS